MDAAVSQECLEKCATQAQTCSVAEGLVLAAMTVVFIVLLYQGHRSLKAEEEAVQYGYFNEP
jgi:hypothetical protein